ncbi:MAG: hypothetical protein ACFFBJ_09490 [Promethearchaeota archaeon]
MGKYHMIVILLVAVILNGAPLIAGHMSVVCVPTRTNTPADVTFNELLTDTEFDDTPFVVINGTSDEFSSSYHAGTGPSDRSHLNLTFTHIANTSLDFRPIEHDSYPDCYDNIYTYQDIEWTRNELPLDAKIQVELQHFLTGNFTSYQYDGYVSLFICVIDSSQNWVKFYDYPIFQGPSIVQTPTTDFTYFDLRDVFDGMIDNGGGQEDPSDIIRLAIGLSPNLNFYRSGSWAYLNGSVTAQLLSLKFETVNGDIDHEYEAYSSVGFGHWGGEYGARFPDMALSDDDSAYVIGQISDYETQTIRHTLVKFNSLGAVVWARSQDRVVGEAVDTRGNDIYTVGWGGNYDVVLIKWGSGGSKAWNKTYDLGEREYGRDLAICSDGSVIIVGDKVRDDPIYGSIADAFMMKIDDQGEVLWTKTFQNMGYQLYQVFVDSDDRIFAVDMGGYPGITEWDHNGNLTEWVYDGVVNTLTMADDYFIVSRSIYSSGLFNITKVTKDGTIVWETSVMKKYGDLWSEWLIADGITVNNEDDIFVIAKHFRFELKWVLYKFDSTGTQEWNRSILSIKWLSLYSGITGEIDLEMGNNGLLYVGGHWIPAEKEPTAIAVAVYNPDEVAVPVILPPLLIAAGAGLAFAIVAVIIYKKRVHR